MLKLVKISKTSLFKDTGRFFLYVSSIKYPACFETIFFTKNIKFHGKLQITGKEHVCSIKFCISHTVNLS